jgi:hypothetical protein
MRNALRLRGRVGDELYAGLARFIPPLVLCGCWHFVRFSKWQRPLCDGPALVGHFGAAPRTAAPQSRRAAGSICVSNCRSSAETGVYFPRCWPRSRAGRAKASRAVVRRACPRRTLRRCTPHGSATVEARSWVNLRIELPLLRRNWSALPALLAQVPRRPGQGVAGSPDVGERRL